MPQYLTPLPRGNSKSPKANIFANRSALLLHELLMTIPEEFSINALSRDLGLSVGLVHRTVSELLHEGYAKSRGVRTAKTYYLANSGALLRRWLDVYNMPDKCRMYTYSSPYSAAEVESKIDDAGLSKSFALALHSACRRLGFSFTNLAASELYILDTEKLGRLEKLLRLEPRDRGYEVLVIEPYYSAILEERSEEHDGLLVSSLLLTFLDLYHFPLRGREQAEHLLARNPTLAGILKALATSARTKKFFHL